jgi:hypothetical protein
MIEDVAMLLSFASGTYVSVVYLDVLVNGVIAYSEVRSAKVYDFYDKEPLISVTQYPQDFRWFLQRSIAPYLDLKSILGLNFALDYCVLAKSTRSSLQVKFTVLFIAMEAFLDRLISQAHQTAQAKSHRSTILRAKIPCLKHCLFHSRDRPQPKYFVLKKLESALQNYSLQDAYGVTVKEVADEGSNYEDIRNKLVHAGDFPRDIDPLRTTLSLRSTFERLLLAVLVYRGYYVDCAHDFDRLRLN